MPFPPFRSSLFAKIILSAGVVLLLGMGVGAWFTVREQRNSSMKHALEGADRLTNTIRLGTHYAMMGNLRDDIASIIVNTSQQEGIRHVRIFNKSGEIKYSNHPREEGSQTNVKDEACFVCHRVSPPLKELSLSERSRVFTGADGTRQLELIAPIYNAPGCSPGPCHVNPEDKQVLGLLDVVVSLEAADAHRDEFIRRTVLLDAAVFLATFLTIFMFVHRVVNRPIKKLIRLTRRIAQGKDTEATTDIRQADEVGQLALAMNTMGRDIRAQHAEIRRQKENYQRLFELVPCIITVQDRDLRLLSYNREFAVKFAPASGQHCYEVYKGRREKCPDCPVEKTFASGRSHVSEESGYCQSGDQAHWIVTTSPVTNADGQITAVMEVCLDITPRKQLERTQARYLAIFDSIPNPVFLLNLSDLSVLDCNDAVEEVYGIRKAAMIGRAFPDFFPEQEREFYRARLTQAASIDQAKQIRPNGLPFYVQIRTTQAEFEQCGAVLVIVQDITKRLETEQQLIQASKMATLGEMATGVAHELNQPLSVIKTASSFLMGKIARGEPIREDILLTMSREIDAHVDRATKIIRHMREFGRKPEPTLEPVDVEAVLVRSFEIFSQQLKLRQIEVIWHLTPGLPPVMADPGRLEQVFINLLINARDAIEEKCQNVLDGAPKHIDLTTRLEGDRVLVEVADTGLGIPRGLREKVFEPFFTTKKIGKGTGLGLSISYSIIQECGGDISVTNRETGGARFTISLPAMKQS